MMSGVKTRSEDYEKARASAYSKIIPRQKLGKGLQTKGIEVVHPGVSRKDCEAGTTENIKPRKALERKDLTQKRWSGQEIVIKSLEHANPSQDNLDHHDHKDHNMQQVNGNAAIFNEERKVLVKIVEEKYILLQQTQEKLQELEIKNEGLCKQKKELETEVMKEKESKGKIEAELIETTKKFAECEKKCAGLYNQVTKLNSKQLQAEEEISTLKQSNENLRAKVSEKDSTIAIMKEQLKSYEDDFRHESEEKKALKKKLDLKEQKNQEYMQSHLTTMRVLKNESDRIKRMQDENICTQLPTQEQAEQ